MPRRPIPRLACLVGLALVGVVAGHAITYAGLSPVAVAREAWLTATGHAYLPVAGRLGLAAAMIVLGGLTLRSLGRPGTVGRALTRRLAAVQVGGFLLLELTERLASGGGLGDLLRVLPVGVVVQIVVALAMASLLRVVLRVGSEIRASADASVPPRPALNVLVPVAAPVRSAAPASPLGGRAPPSSLVT